MEKKAMTARRLIMTKSLKCGMMSRLSSINSNNNNNNSSQSRDDSSSGDEEKEEKEEEMGIV
jgi:hypothetical protein